MNEEQPDLNVYGHNLPPEDRAKTEPGIREKKARTKKGPAVVHAVDEHLELAETPMPTRHAPLSDEVPS